MVVCKVSVCSCLSANTQACIYAELFICFCFILSAGQRRSPLQHFCGFCSFWLR
ncbi:hypothetical protein Gohar_026302 [Gossypium harknessii]|uniref:Uncharacterized protein n=1 Tax=Gossypium harknessii TaxID=34285 RepID=A0A7J9HR58_9ROSI|nr:hypothetical protein [Gossypium harknessii]